MELFKNYIHGSWTESHEQQTINVVNPANQEILGKVPYGEKTGKMLIWLLQQLPKRWQNGAKLR